MISAMDLTSNRRLVSFAALLVVCLWSSLTLSQNPPASALKAADIVAYLTETISWYRGTAVEQQIANEPSDLTFLNDNRRISSQIVRLAFDFARLEEQNESKQPKGNQTQEKTNATSQYQRLTQAAANADQQVEQSQNELQSLRQKLQATQGRKRPALESQIAETFARVIGRPVKLVLPVKGEGRRSEEEMTAMFNFFNGKGYDADILALRKLHPGLLTLEAWLRKNGWENA